MPIQQEERTNAINIWTLWFMILGISLLIITSVHKKSEHSVISKVSGISDAVDIGSYTEANSSVVLQNEPPLSEPKKIALDTQGSSIITKWLEVTGR